MLHVKGCRWLHRHVLCFTFLFLNPTHETPSPRIPKHPVHAPLPRPVVTSIYNVKKKKSKFDTRVKYISTCGAVDGPFLWRDLPDVQPRVSTVDPSLGAGLQQEKAQGWGWESTGALCREWRPGHWSAHLVYRNGKGSGGPQVHTVDLRPDRFGENPAQ